jgi:hypothetical protein
MAKDVTVTSSNQEIDPFEQFGHDAAARAHIVGDMLRFTKHGEWKAGQDQEVLEEGTRMLLFMPSLKHGWVKWEDQQPVRHVVGYIAEKYKPPHREELGDLDEAEWGELDGRKIDPWQFTFYVQLCDESGQVYTYVTSSKGGKNALGEVAEVYGRHRRMKEDEIPIIELHSRSYDHKSYGETFAPVLKRTGWGKIPTLFEEAQATLESDGEEEQDQIPFDITPPKKIAAKPEAKPRGRSPKALNISSKPSAKGPPPKSAKKNGPSRGVRF